MVNFTRVSDLLKDLYPTLTVCSDNGSPVKVMQWQCSGEISIDTNYGVKKEDQLFLNKARKFIEKSLETNADLVLTPEYSFPFPILDEILNNSENWPRQGQLWCLGTQGENHERLKQKLQAWETIPNIHVESCAMDDLEINSFVSPLIYLFKSNDQKLVILPQYKTRSMADPRNNFEGPNLSRGNNIFVFDLGNSRGENVFLSIICADALHIHAHEIMDVIPERYITIFHPQLNSEPRYDDLVSFRKSFFKTNRKDTRIITLNWAINTCAITPQKTYHFRTPWSAYFKTSKVTNSLNNTIRNNKENNHKQGTSYVLNDHFEIWYSDREEHCKAYVISKGDNGPSPLPVTSRDEPTPIGYYVYDQVNNEWILEQNKCASNIKDLFLQVGAPMDLPYPVCSDEPGNCDKCKKTDFFYGSLFGKFEEHEIICSEEKVARLLVGPDEESDTLRREKLDMVLHLKSLLDHGKLPKSLKYLKNNYVFKISDEFPRQGLQNFNVAPIVSKYTDSEALVVLTKETDLSKVKSLFNELTDNLSLKYRNQILLYYKIAGTGYAFYDAGINEKSIIAPYYINNTTSIKKAFSKLFGRGGI